MVLIRPLVLCMNKWVPNQNWWSIYDIPPIFPIPLCLLAIVSKAVLCFLLNCFEFIFLILDLSINIFVSLFYFVFSSFPNCKGHGENEFYNMIEHILSCLFPHLALTSLWFVFFWLFSSIYIFKDTNIYTYILNFLPCLHCFP